MGFFAREREWNIMVSVLIKQYTFIELKCPIFIQE